MSSKAITVVAGVIQNKGRLLLTRRFDGAHLGGAWEFPGGKVESEESLEEALIREIQEELAIKIKVDTLIQDEKFAYPDREVHLHFFYCHILKGRPRAIGVAEMAWILPSELDQYCVPRANEKLIDRLKKINWKEVPKDATIP